MVYCGHARAPADSDRTAGEPWSLVLLNVTMIVADNRETIDFLTFRNCLEISRSVQTPPAIIADLGS